MTSHPVDTLIRSTKIDDPIAMELLPEFVAALPPRVGAMLRCLEARDWAGLRELVHRLGGIGTPFGFDEVTHLAVAAECAVVQRRPTDEIVAGVRALVRHLRCVEGYDAAREVNHS